MLRFPVGRNPLLLTPSITRYLGTQDFIRVGLLASCEADVRDIESYIELDLYRCLVIGDAVGLSGTV